MCVCMKERVRVRERENIKKVAEDPHLRLYLVGLLTTTVVHNCCYYHVGFPYQSRVSQAVITRREPMIKRPVNN